MHLGRFCGIIQRQGRLSDSMTDWPRYAHPHVNHNKKYFQMTLYATVLAKQITCQNWSNLSESVKDEQHPHYTAACQTRQYRQNDHDISTHKFHTRIRPTPASTQARSLDAVAEIASV